MATPDFDCAVIGSGPAGLLSALYLMRFGRTTLLLGFGEPRAARIPRSHNLIGFDRGLSGGALLARMRRQVHEVGLDPIDGQARIRPSRAGVEIEWNGGRARARRAILATGVEDVDPPLENLRELRAAGLLRYCPICDGYEFRDEKIAVIADGEAGAKRALFLAPYARRLTVAIPESARLSDQTRRRIRLIGARLVASSLLGIEPAAHGKGAWVTWKGRRPELFRAVYVELGARVRDEAFAHVEEIERSPGGCLITDARMRTSSPNVFAAGDCVEGLSQIAVAAGQAAIAATTAHNDLRQEGWHRRAPKPGRQPFKPLKLAHRSVER